MSYNPIFSNTINKLNKNTTRFSKISNIKYKQTTGYDEETSDIYKLSLSQCYDRFFQAIRPSKKLIVKSCINENFVNDYISKNNCLGYTGYTGCNSDIFSCSQETIFSEKQYCVYKSILHREDILKGIIIIVLNFLSRKVVSENINKVLTYEEQEMILKKEIIIGDYISLYENIREQVDNLINLENLSISLFENFEETKTTKAISSFSDPKKYLNRNVVTSLDLVSGLFEDPRKLVNIKDVYSLSSNIVFDPLTDTIENEKMPIGKKVYFIEGRGGKLPSISTDSKATLPKMTNKVEIRQGVIRNVFQSAIIETSQDPKLNIMNDSEISKTFEENLNKQIEKQENVSFFVENTDGNQAYEVQTGKAATPPPSVTPPSGTPPPLGTTPISSLDDITSEIMKEDTIKITNVDEKKAKQSLKTKFKVVSTKFSKSIGDLVKKMNDSYKNMKANVTAASSAVKGLALSAISVLVNVLIVASMVLLLFLIIDTIVNESGDYYYVTKKELRNAKQRIDDLLKQVYYEQKDKDGFSNAPYPLIRGPFENTSVLFYKNELEEEIIKDIIRIDNLYLFNKDFKLQFEKYDDYINYEDGGGIYEYFSKKMISQIISDFLSKKVIESDFNRNDIISKYISLLNLEDRIFEGFNGLCRKFDGIPGTIPTKNKDKNISFCSYSKSTCDNNLYDWSKVKEIPERKWWEVGRSLSEKEQQEKEKLNKRMKEETEKYAEFKPISDKHSACVFSLPHLRSVCENNGLPYNSTTGICDGINIEYCTKKSIFWNPADQDCTANIAIDVMDLEKRDDFLKDIPDDVFKYVGMSFVNKIAFKYSGGKEMNDNLQKLGNSNSSSAFKDGQPCKKDEYDQYYEMKSGFCLPTGKCKDDYKKIQNKCVSKETGKSCESKRFIGVVDYSGKCKTKNICRKDFILYNGECISQNLGNDCKISSTSLIDNKTMITEDGLVSEDGTCDKILTKKQPLDFLGNPDPNSEKKCYPGFSGGYTDCLYKPSSISFGNMGDMGMNFGGAGGIGSGGGCNIL